MARPRDEDPQFFMSAQTPKLAKLTDRFGCETHCVSYLHAHAIRKFFNHLVQVFDGARTECIEARRRPLQQLTTNLIMSCPILGQLRCLSWPMPPAITSP